MKKSVIEILYKEFALMLQPLEGILKDADSLSDFMLKLGWYFPSDITTNIQTISQKVNALISAVDVIDFNKSIVDQYQEYAKLLEVSTELVKEVVDAKKIFPNNIDELAVGLNGFKSKIGKQILDYLIISHFEYNYNFQFQLLHFLGVFQLTEHDFIAEKPGYTERSVNWEQLPKVISGFDEILEEQYNWGSQSEELKSDKLLTKIEDILLSFYLPVKQEYIDSSYGEKLFYKIGQVPNPISWQDYSLLNIPLYEIVDLEEGYSEIGFNIIPIPDRSLDTKRIIGISVVPYLEGEVDVEFVLSEQSKLSLNGDFASDIVINILPHEKPEVLLEHQDSNLDLNLGIVYIKSISDGKVILFGQPDKTRLDYQEFTAALVFKDLTKPQKSLSFKSSIVNGNFVFEPKQGDGFISKILEPINANFDIDIYVSQNGIHVNGSAALETVIAIHKGFGGFTLKNLYIGLAGNKEHISLYTKSDFEVSLGPIYCGVNQIGLESKLKFNQKGNLGEHNVSLGFIPPNEIAISLDSPTISGGGFLAHDPNDKSYAGILALNLQAIELTAIGLITTQLPNNQKGFSMLICINVLFNPAIQLSFGFTLVGVGGLLGVNRTMAVDALRQRLASGAVNSIMFPEDPIENADRIIADLKAVFPVKEKHYIIAPFLRIGYGTPSIVEVDLGVLIEIPFKGRIILLGSVGIYLPAKDAPLSEIHIDILGDFNFADRYIRVEGRLRDSHIVNIPLSGGFAFLLDWGDRPAFLFSIGGYHPRYKKPERFPEIPRLKAVIQKGSKVVLTCEYYQAITSNTFQIGFSATLVAHYKGARVDGYLGFNAFLQFDPFYFEIDINLSVRVKYKGKKLAGIDLYFKLVGPAPWVASGFAKISVAKLFKLKIDFRVEWGDPQKEPKTYIQTDELLQKLKQSLEAPQNWTTKATALPNTESSVLLRPSEEILEEGLIMPPNGYLEVRQTVVPLNFHIRKFGNAEVPDAPIFQIERAEEGAINLGESKAFQDIFARGQFIEIPDSKKFSTPDFESFDAGLSFRNLEDDAMDFGIEEEFTSNADLLEEEFENIIIKADRTKMEQEESNTLLKHEVSVLVRKQQAKLGTRQRKVRTIKGNRYQVFDDSPTVQQDRTYRIVRKDDLSHYNEKIFNTYTEAEEYLNYEVQQEKDELQINSAEHLAVIA